MDDKEVGKLHLSHRSWQLIMPLVVTLMASLLWNYRQIRLIEQERQRIVAVEHEQATHAKKEIERQDERAKRNTRWKAMDARVQQLYREIDGLSHINEQISMQPQHRQQTLPKNDDQAVKISGASALSEAEAGLQESSDKSTLP
jgi:hypothetical protein